MDNPKLLYAMKLAHLRSLERLIGDARKTLAEISRLESESPAGELNELYWINDDLDSLETSVSALADSVESLL